MAVILIYEAYRGSGSFRCLYEVFSAFFSYLSRPIHASHGHKAVHEQEPEPFSCRPWARPAGMLLIDSEWRCEGYCAASCWLFRRSSSDGSVHLHQIAIVSGICSSKSRSHLSQDDDSNMVCEGYLADEPMKHNVPDSARPVCKFHKVPCGCQRIYAPSRRRFGARRSKTIPA